MAQNGAQNSTLPAQSAFAVTPADGADLAVATRWLYVGTAGTLTVRMLDGSTVAFGAVTAGSLLPIRVDRVLATGTGASNIVALV